VLGEERALAEALEELRRICNEEEHVPEVASQQELPE
jgi:hypothetical protein